MLFSSQFTLPEILSLLGLAQSLYVLVYMLLRSGNVKHALIPSAYFAILAVAFFMDAAARHIGGHFQIYGLIQWIVWFAGLPLGTLLILQVAQVTALPSVKFYGLLLLIPLTMAAYLIPEQGMATYIAGLVAGAISLLTLWGRKDLFSDLHGNPRYGEERFWLVLSLIALNVAFLASTFAFISDWVPLPQWMLLRTLLGISFVYIAATSLFRIYPQALQLQPRRGLGFASLGHEDKILLDKIETLFQRDKIYQDPAFGRAELAREVGTGEANLSRIINIHYSKTIPQILNEYRVKDAQRLLKETDAPVSQIFEESGFNSITTFNRVFKDLAGETPKEYRARSRS